MTQIQATSSAHYLQSQIASEIHTPPCGYEIHPIDLNSAIAPSAYKSGFPCLTICHTRARFGQLPQPRAPLALSHPHYPHHPRQPPRDLSRCWPRPWSVVSAARQPIRRRQNPTAKMPFTAYCTGAEAFWQTPVRGPEWPNSSMTMTMVSSKHSMWCRQGTASIQGSGGQNTCVWWVAQDLRSWHVELRGPFQPAGVLLSSAIRFSLMAADCPGCSTASSLIGAGRGAFPRPEERGARVPTPGSQGTLLAEDVPLGHR